MLLGKRFGWRSVLDIVTSVVLIGAAGIVVYANVYGLPGDRAAASLQVPAKPISIRDAPIRGRQSAKVVIVVYSDFECPFCRRFVREVLPEIERRYIAGGKILMAFRHFPLPIHKHAVQAAVSADCAGEQNRFWEMHDRLFAETSLDNQRIQALAETSEIDVERYRACMSRGSHVEQLEASLQEYRALGVRSTPAFFIGTKLPDQGVRVVRAISGARSIEQFVDAIDASLSTNTREGSWFRFSW